MRTAYFRQVLPHACVSRRVRGFPTLRVLCLIRHPMTYGGLTQLRLYLAFLFRCSVLLVRFRSNLFQGFPDPCLNNRIPCCNLSHRQESMGLPKFLRASLPACHGLWTPADRNQPRHYGRSCFAFGTVDTLGIRNNPYFEAVPALQEARPSLRPTGFSVYASPVLFAAIFTTPPQAQDSIRVDG